MTNAGDPHRVTIICEYHEPYATLNSLWAAMDQHDWFPDTILLLAAKEGEEPTGSDVTEAVADLVGAWHEAYDGSGDIRDVAVDPISPDAVSYNLDRYQMEPIQNEHDDVEVAIDLTPGRTLMKIGLMDWARDAETDPAHVFYLDVDAYDYREAPYPTIPRRLQTSRDIQGKVM